MGPVEVRPAENLLVIGERTARVEPKSMDVLMVLARAAGQLVERDDLVRQVWPRGYVTDDTYIHLRYVQNLLTRGEFSFNPGVSTYGATSPLWILGLVLLPVGLLRALFSTYGPVPVTAPVLAAQPIVAP